MPFILTAVCRASAALGGLAFIIIIASLYSPENVGQITLAITLHMGGVILARRGLDFALMKFSSIDLHSNDLYKCFVYSIRSSFAFGVIISLFLMLFTEEISQLLSTPELEEVLIYYALAIPISSISFICSGLLKGVKKTNFSAFCETGGSSLLSCFGILILAAFFSTKLSLSSVAITFLISSLVLSTFALLYCFRIIRERSLKQLECISENGNTIQEFKSLSWNFTAINISNFMQQSGLLIVTGFALTNHDLGLYRVSQRAAFSVGFIILVIESIFPPKFSRLYLDCKRTELSNSAKQASLIGFFTALVPFAFLFFWGEHFLLMIGPSYVEAKPILLIFCLAQIINASIGPVNFLLTMTNYAHIVKKITLSSNVCFLILLILNLPNLTPIKSAIITSFALVAPKLIMAKYAYKNLLKP